MLSDLIEQRSVTRHLSSSYKILQSSVVTNALLLEEDGWSITQWPRFHVNQNEILPI